MPASLDRRNFCRDIVRQTLLCGTAIGRTALGTAATLAISGSQGCGPPAGQFGRLDKVWGRRGVSPGRLQKPRAMAIDSNDELYIVDILARIQVFDADGNFLRGWKTPVHKNGRPTGLTVATSPQDGQQRLLVADTHYFRILQYALDGTLLEEATIGGQEGRGPGEFGFVTDAVQDTEGNYYVSQYGEYDRIQKFSPTGEYLHQWGSHGRELGQFVRPQSLLIDKKNQLWVTDSCNHRVQVFNPDGKRLFSWGAEGSEPGKLFYPYGIAMDNAGDIYLCEYGNSRVQKFTPDGESLGIFGSQGRGPGELHNPWTTVIDSKGRLHVLDTYNHRVQRVVV